MGPASEANRSRRLGLPTLNLRRRYFNERGSDATYAFGAFGSSRGRELEEGRPRGPRDLGPAPKEAGRVAAREDAWEITDSAEKDAERRGEFAMLGASEAKRLSYRVYDCRAYFARSA
jgi:hypothetical protein